MVRYPPLVLSFTQAHLCDTPFFNISRDNCAIPHKNLTGTKEFCDTIAASIARYGKYRYWASKSSSAFRFRFGSWAILQCFAVLQLKDDGDGAACGSAWQQDGTAAFGDNAEKLQGRRIDGGYAMARRTLERQFRRKHLERKQLEIKNQNS